MQLLSHDSVVLQCNKKVVFLLFCSFAHYVRILLFNRHILLDKGLIDMHFLFFFCICHCTFSTYLYVAPILLFGTAIYVSDWLFYLLLICEINNDTFCSLQMLELLFFFSIPCCVRISYLFFFFRTYN